MPILLTKYCEKKHNLARGCPTIHLGTLQSYAQDDPNFLKYDYEEGVFKYTNNQKQVDLTWEEASAISKGAIQGSISVQPGATFQGRARFPNCYIFCLSASLPPRMETGKSIDPSYDDFFCVTDLPRFCSTVAKLLREQLTLSDLKAPPTCLIDIGRIEVQVVVKEVSYVGREQELTNDRLGSVVEAQNAPIDWIFLKDPEHSSIQEYRIAVLVLDSYRNPIPVNSGGKLLHLRPDLGVGLWES